MRIGGEAARRPCILPRVSLGAAIGDLRTACAAFDPKGETLELVTEDLLREMEFVNVRRQNAGTQFGRDISADLRDPTGAATQWYVESKNWEGRIGVADLGAKLIWHLAKLRLTGGFVVVGPSELSNELREILSAHPFPFRIYDWTGEAFARLVTLCADTRGKWFPNVVVPGLTSDERKAWRDLLFSCGTGGTGYAPEHPLRVHVEVVHTPPFQQAYALFADTLVRFDTDERFEHRLCWSNVGDSQVMVTAIRVRTLARLPLPARLLLLRKLKGEFDPLRLDYVLPRSGESNEILNGRVRRLDPGESECHALRLIGYTEPGVHDVEIVIDYFVSGVQRTAVAARLRVCAGASDPDAQTETLNLYVFRRYYERLAEALLQRPADWARIRSAATDEAMIYLGPTQVDAMATAGDTRHVPWGVRRMRIERDPGDRRGSSLTNDVDEVVSLAEVTDEIHPGPTIEAQREQIEQIAAFYGLTYEQFRDHALAQMQPPRDDE